MKKIIVPGVIALLVIAAFTGWWFQRSTDNPQIITLYGNVDIRQVSLAFNASGRIDTLLVQEGDRVKAGQLLGRLDTQALDIQSRQAAAQLAAQQQTLQEQQRGARPAELAQAQAELASAQAEQRKAQLEIRRLRAIADATQNKGVSQQDREAATSSLLVASAQVKERQAHLSLVMEGARAEQRQASIAQRDALKAGLDLINYQRSQGELHSPVDAVIRARLAEPGDMTSPQQSVFSLALASPKWVCVWLNETDLGRIQEGMKANITTDSFPNRPVQGTISYISSVAEFTPKSVQTEELRTHLVYEVRVRVEDSNNLLRMGQPATVTIDTANQTAAPHE
ncbi:HlyD family efflux transporter periplasmic adaptor subunit [Rosenbergiella metrosideri]|uniref:HlyD family efflux transporter periplasmic adaptor subunit n=1 Tax=Rosenbergiella metrosideri TaxID=2921185 RepID=UPI001F4F7199|nr:HlyD family efflux transporter periplasmic adaptor subunit [Rosenbergiella metrosideri]